MNRHPEFSRNYRRLPALTATLALHVLLVLLWQVARQQPEATSGDVARIQWVNVTPQQRAAAPVAVAAAPVRLVKKRAPTRLARTPLAAPAPPAAPYVAPLADAAAAVLDAPPMPSAADMLARARKDLAGIDKELRKDFPEARIKAPLDTSQARLEKGFELAHEMAPPKWYEQAKIKELTVPAGHGARRYRVITAFGTYCVTYGNNYTAAVDTMQQGIKPKMSTCPIPFGKPKA